MVRGPVVRGMDDEAEVQETRFDPLVRAASSATEIRAGRSRPPLEASLRHLASLESEWGAPVKPMKTMD